VRHGKLFQIMMTALKGGRKTSFLPQMNYFGRASPLHNAMMNGRALLLIGNNVRDVAA
jgi:hypothetical protein